MFYQIDFETKGPLSLPDVGLRRYLHAQGANIVCMAWKAERGPTQMWEPGRPWPFKPAEGDIVYAHNAVFDWYVWNLLAQKYGSGPLHLDHMVCTMALCGRFTLPQALAFAGSALGIKLGKDRSGKALMKKICTPPYEYTLEEYNKFLEYCKRDVDAMDEMLHALPMQQLSPLEQEIWKLTVKMNLRGVPVDEQTVRTIFQVNKVYVEKASRELPVITKGAVQKHTQATAIVRWAESEGVSMPNCQAATVAEFLAKDDLPPNVRQVLQLRRDLALTSTAKYKKLMELSFNGRIYENLRYYAASTGRWGGMGAQLHNLPRLAPESAEDEIRKFEDRSILRENPLASAKSLVRSMIKAPKGKVLVVADFSFVEVVGVMWVADDFRTLKHIAEGKDPYKIEAVSMMNVAYSEVTKFQRQSMKPVVLGAGYGLGAVGLIGYAEGYGIELDREQAQAQINGYRAAHPNVVKYWYRAKDSMLNAIKDPGHEYHFGKCVYQCVRDQRGVMWLCLTLPSGRTLFYMSPEIRLDEYGELPTHMGIDSYTNKWKRLKIIPGRIIENIVQAMCRDLLADLKLCLERVLPEQLILSVHDEVVLECDADRADYILQDVIGMMRVPPKWAHGMPLDGDGFVTKRYKKG